MSQVQQLWHEPLWAQSKEGASIQKSDPMWPSFRRHGPDGKFWFYATIEKFQASESWLCRGSKEKLHHFDISFTTPGMFRYLNNNTYLQKKPKNNLHRWILRWVPTQFDSHSWLLDRVLQSHFQPGQCLDQWRTWSARESWGHHWFARWIH